MKKKLNFVGMRKESANSKESHNYGTMRIMNIFELVFLNTPIIWLIVKSLGNDLQYITNSWIMSIVYWTISEILSKYLPWSRTVIQHHCNLVFVLQHQVTNECRFYYASRNNCPLSLPHLIRNLEDFEQLIKNLLALNLEQDIYNECPNSKWQTERITNLQVGIIPTDCSLGEVSELSNYAKDSPHIITLENNKNIALVR